MTEPFDPQQHVVDLKGKKYLEVQWRLVWLRDRHPDAVIRQELIDHDKAERWALFRTSVEIPGGGIAEGFGSESARDFGDYIEKAATKSLGRALAALGFGTQFSAHEFGGEADSGRVVDAPVNLPARTRTTSENTVPVAGPGAITPAQMGMIRGLAEEKGIPPEKVREMHGKESAKLLTKQEASELIDRLQGRLEAMPEPPNDAERWTS